MEFKASNILTAVAFLALVLVKVEGELSAENLRDLFTSLQLDTNRDPITELGRQGIQRNLRNRLSAISALASSGRGGGQESNQYLEPTFQTKVFADVYGRVKDVVGINFILVFHGGANMSDDSPIVLLANYDTDEREELPVGDNGSGIVALVALAEHVAYLRSNGKLKLDRSLILAATDIALGKYETGRPEGGVSGGEELVTKWLPRFMEDRARFGGAIVLDSIMNYQTQAFSQRDALHFSKPFPSAYQQMSKTNFSGDFLAVVVREEDQRSPLLSAFRRGWALSKPIDEEYSHPINPSLIELPYSNATFVTSSPAVTHFLKSEQVAFWNQVDGGSKRRILQTKRLPALLLTDTEKFRKASCDQFCSLDKVTNPANMAFLERTVNALFNTVKQLQIDGEYDNGGMKGELSSCVLIFGLILRQLAARLI